MIELDVQETGPWTAIITDAYGSTRNLDVSSFRVLGHVGENLLHLFLRSVAGSRLATQKSMLAKFNKEFGHTLRLWNLASLPSSESDWQDFVVALYSHVLGRDDTNRRLVHRCKDWNSVVAPYLELLRDVEGIIPLGVEIPRTKARPIRELSDSGSYRDQLIGQGPPTAANLVIDKTLIGVSTARSDPRYLEEVRDQLSQRRRILHDNFLRWWRQIKRHYEYGLHVQAQVDTQMLQKVLSTGKTRGRSFVATPGNPHIVNGKTEKSLGILLHLINSQYGGKCCRKTFTTSPLLPSPAVLGLPETAPPVESELLTNFNRLNWMVGNLRHHDIAIIAGLLTMHNASFTTYSLLFAKIRKDDSRTYLEYDDRGARFRIEKARAKAMKDSPLDDLSAEIIETLIRMSSIPRGYLSKADSPAADLLFLSHTNGIFGPASPNQVARILTVNDSASKPTLFDYMPQLATAGFEKGTITLPKIRATEGVLEWFKTGSIGATSRKLGNTKQVVLGHYLPKPLLAAWSTRSIRRFQNLWLAVAAAREEFLLEATDFHCLEDLHTFLNDMLAQHSSTSSPLAVELHQLFGRMSDAGGVTARENSLAVAVSESSLTYLYLYQESALEAGVEPAELDLADAQGIRPRMFLDLAELLRHQLPNHCDPELRSAHSIASERVSQLGAKMQWKTLFVQQTGSL